MYTIQQQNLLINGKISTEMLNLSYGAVTVKRKLSVRETAEVIRKSHLKKKIRPWLSSYVTNPKIRNGAQIATKETRGLKIKTLIYKL